MTDAPDPAATYPRSSAVWRHLLPEAVQAAGAVPWLGPTAVDHLGDPDGERVDLLAGRPAVVPRLALAHLRLIGADRIAFLHGLVSHDVAGLPEGGAVDALLLDHKGQPQGGLGIVRRSRDLFVTVEDGVGDAVRRVLVDHVIFDQVEIEALDDRLVSVTVTAAEADAVAMALEAAWPGAAAAT
ncbi:MAG: hypothetical protein O3A02_02025, partial [bacterium]|nr:hypothetical protein [bacterium]